MPWPIVVPTGTRTNTTPHIDQHPDDHNKIAAALNDLSAVDNALSRVVRWGGGSFTSTKTWNIGTACPTFPYAGVVLMVSMVTAGFSAGGANLRMDAYSNAVNLGPGVLVVDSAQVTTPAGGWSSFPIVTMLAPVAAGGKPDLQTRIWLLSGANFYAHGISTVLYMPGASVPASEIAPM